MSDITYKDACPTGACCDEELDGNPCAECDASMRAIGESFRASFGPGPLKRVTYEEICDAYDVGDPKRYAMLKTLEEEPR